MTSIGAAFSLSRVLMNLTAKCVLRLWPRASFWTSSQFANSGQLVIAHSLFCLKETTQTCFCVGFAGEPLPISSERDVFDYIGMEYKEPKDRRF